MRWSDERYVRIYVRDTEDLLAVGWEGRSVLWELCRKADRLGMVPSTDPALLAEMLRLPRDLCSTGIERLVTRGTVVMTRAGVLIRNFLEAQEAPASPAARAKTYRERKKAEADARREKRDEIVMSEVADVTKRDDAVTFREQIVTGNHEPSRVVTPIRAVPCRAVPIRTNSLDLESVYARYPRKEGKTKGMERLRRDIQTEEQLHELGRAVNNYADLVRKRGTDSKYVKHFATFASCWRDYLAVPDDGQRAPEADGYRLYEPPDWVKKP